MVIIAAAVSNTRSMMPCRVRGDAQSVECGDQQMSCLQERDTVFCESNAEIRTQKFGLK